MLTGVPPSKHGVTWNSVVPTTRIVYSRWPTLFEIAHRAGYTTAMVSGKSKFLGLTPPASLTWSFVPKAAVISDSAVVTQAIDWIQRYAPQVLFVHLPAVDSAGHASGWGSPEQQAAIAGADRCIGRLLDALRERGVTDSTLVLITADHGGAGMSHGGIDPRSLMIPWIAAGPGVRPDYDLTQDEDLSVRTEDTFATLCYVLGLTSPKPVDGRPVLPIFTAKLEKP
jgi:arylsulfatase A-like enzyme